jgi:hypothetical protein
MYIYFNRQQIKSTSYFQGQSAHFYSAHQVRDEVRGYLVWQSGIWNFVLHQNYTPGNKSIKKIALLLESPHKDEYTTNFVPIRPANGKTGTNIDNKLHYKLISDLALCQQHLCNNYDYEIYLINCVQYQCSCHYFLNLVNLSCDRRNTDQIFRAFYKHLKSDFILRINQYKPDYIYNCCTKSVIAAVDTCLKKHFSHLFIFKGIHPSRW